jgi:hypothetical protein
MSNKFCEIKIVIPDNETKKLFEFLSNELDLSQTDEEWTVCKRNKDNSYYEYGPSLGPSDRKKYW